MKWVLIWYIFGVHLRYIFVSNAHFLIQEKYSKWPRFVKSGKSCVMISASTCWIDSFIAYGYSLVVKQNLKVTPFSALLTIVSKSFSDWRGELRMSVCLSVKIELSQKRCVGIWCKSHKRCLEM